MSRSPATSRAAATFYAATVVAAFLSMSAERRAFAQEAPSEAEACFTAAERAQPLVKQKRLREARAELEVCARDVCPKVARTDCRNWLADVAREQPSIVIAVREVNDDGDGRDVTGARAVIDGAIVIDRVDGRPTPIDPGPHRLRVERPGFEPQERTVELQEGEKGKVVPFSWHTSFEGPKPTASKTSRPTPPSVYIMGVLGVGALGVGTYLEVDGLRKRDTELQPCAPTCSRSTVDSVRDTVRAGDITLGGGALFALGAIILYVTRPSVTEPREEARTVVTGGPVPGGWVAGLQRSF